MRYLCLLTCLLALCSCTNPSRVIDGRYYHPSGSYSFEAPSHMYGQKMEEIQIDQTRSLVSFHDDFGNLLRFEVAKFPDEFAVSSLTLADQEKALETVFENSVLAAIKQQIPTTKVLNKDVANIEGIGATYFAVVYVPNGSTLIDCSTGQREDSRRGYLLSFCENYLFVISNQESGLTEFAAKHSDVKVDRTEKLREELVKARLSCKITK